MTDRSKIEWCDATINPVTGCSPVSEGCKGCYAARLAATRLKHHPMYKGLATYKDGRGHWTGEIRLNPSELDKPLRWRKPRRIFVCPAGDLFHDDIDIDSTLYSDLFSTISKCPQHTFIVPTKRPKKMKWVFERYFNPRFSNVWLGFTAENQARFDERWAHAKQIPAAAIWVSHEPALGRIDYPTDFLAMERRAWVVTGGESGPKARPTHPDTPRHDRDQCQTAGVPYFFKQWGEWCPAESLPEASILQNGNEAEHQGHNDTKGYWFNNGYYAERVGKKAAGRMLDGRTWEEFPT